MNGPPPFQDPMSPMIFILIGGLLVLAILLLFLYIKERDKDSKDISDKQEDQELRIDNIGLTKKSKDVLEEVMKKPSLQSELPSKLNVSKATVSNAVTELFDRKLIKKKKRANTYLIEPNYEKIEEEQK